MNTYSLFNKMGFLILFLLLYDIQDNLFLLLEVLQ